MRSFALRTTASTHHFPMLEFVVVWVSSMVTKERSESDSLSSLPVLAEASDGDLTASR